MRLILFFCFVTLAAGAQCPPLPDTCHCDCWSCEYGHSDHIEIECTSVPDLRSFLETFENTRLNVLEIHKCDKPLKHLAKLPSFRAKGIRINHCGLETIADDAFMDISDIESVDLSNNLLTQMPKFKKLTTLNAVFMSHNQLQSFNIKPNDTTIDYYGCFDDSDIGYLDLRNNSITEITDSTFANLKNLDHLDLSDNHIRHISADAFLDLEQMSEFNLSYNHLVTLEPGTFKNLDIYAIFSLNNNRLTHLDASAFIGNNRLFELDLSNNQISRIDPGVFHGMYQLMDLNLNNNNLTFINGTVFEDVKQLQFLYLSDNLFDEIPNSTFAMLKGLSRLDLSNNQIRAIDPNAFVGVEDLKLNHNNLTIIESVFGQENRMRYLNLSNNAIEITNTTFNGLTQLTYLDVSYNQISYVPPYSFISTNLIHLDISNNKLTTLEPYSVSVRGSPNVINYSGNAFVCDEKLQWFTDYIKFEVGQGKYYDDINDVDVYVDPVICPEPKSCSCPCVCSDPNASKASQK